MHRYYLCEWDAHVENGQTVYRPAIWRIDQTISYQAVDLREDLNSADAAYVMADTSEAQHTVLIADPAVEYLYDA